MNNMNVIIADDHPIVLFGIRKSLEQIEWVNVVGEFEDSTALINNLPKLDAHVLITDLSMPGDKYGDGITLIKYIKRHFPELSIIVLTMNNNPAILSAVLDLDIEGIVLKQGAPTDLPKALAALQKGKKFTPESVSRLLEKISAGGYGDSSCGVVTLCNHSPGARSTGIPICRRQKITAALPGQRPLSSSSVNKISSAAGVWPANCRTVRP